MMQNDGDKQAQAHAIKLLQKELRMASAVQAF